jgi:hypothetical protein
VFVDQAPLQNRTDDWQLGSRGCYDEASLGALRQTLLADLGAIADGNEAGALLCVSGRLQQTSRRT